MAREAKKKHNITTATTDNEKQSRAKLSPKNEWRAKQGKPMISHDINRQTTSRKRVQKPQTNALKVKKEREKPISEEEWNAGPIANKNPDDITTWEALIKLKYEFPTCEVVYGDKEITERDVREACRNREENTKNNGLDR
ncbi:MAG: hypothetical protein LBM01_02675 [Christensenellaceae bacterium]|jgi:hypothetical protein|nr:hypothetical protein [Christensenellaceae bacterium]